MQRDGPTAGWLTKVLSKPLILLIGNVDIASHPGERIRR
jgi:hypothetical protein